MAEFPEINTKEQLLSFLRAEFAYCGCGYYEEAIRDLRTVLEFSRQRQESLGDTDRFYEITSKFDDWLLNSPGLSTWFIWLLDERDFIWHGKRTSDSYITEKGQLVLTSINQYCEFDD